MIHELQKPLWMDTPKGISVCYFMIDYGPEADLLWVCFDDKTGQCWTWPNNKIRLVQNISLDSIRGEK